MFDPASLIDLGLGAAALAGLRVFKRDMVAAVDRVGERIDKLDTRVKTIETPPARDWRTGALIVREA